MRAFWSVKEVGGRGQSVPMTDSSKLLSYRALHSDLNDQNLFQSTIDDQTEVHFGEYEWYDSAKNEETVKNHQNEQKLSKKPCFLKVFRILFNLG